MGPFFEFSPTASENLMSDQLTILETWIIVVEINNTKIIPEAPMNYSMNENNSQEFVLNEFDIQVLYSTPEERKGFGIFCDKQTIN